MLDRIRDFDDAIALWVTRQVATMRCAYIFAVLAAVSLPDAIHSTFGAGFHPLPGVQWLSGTFLQLVLLSIIMVGQDRQAARAERRAAQDHDALRELLADERRQHHERHQALLAAVREKV